MSLSCTRCEGSGFLNLAQIPDGVIDLNDCDQIVRWIAENGDHDVMICDCCGDGDSWYGTPGEHYNSEDPAGVGGPYKYNGGLCKCH